ncbi:MAG: hypothetical protein HON23_03455 [Rickettsiales bacterium]|nr:hypothetical protein [Rickettsiales bacterium]
MPHWPKPIGFYKQINNHDTTLKALEYLGNPQNKLNNVIHIAGTNGKGSTLAYIKQILLSNNHSVNCYTSPHLLNFNEQIFLKNCHISDHDLKSFLEEVRSQISDKFTLTFFETITIATLYIFSKVQADFNLIETGLGGRIDATNVFKKKYISILSPISYDHLEYLGDNLMQITCEKSDILLNSEKVVIAKQKPIVNACLKIIFAQNNISSAAFFKEAYDFDMVDNIFHYIDIESEEIIQYSEPSLLGCHQLINLATALTTTNFISKEFCLTHNNTNQAILNTKWPGRLERINIADKFLTNKNTEIYFDGAHNDQGARSLALWIKKTKFDGKTILIYGRTKGKNHNSFLTKFRNHISDIYLVSIQSEPLPASILEMQQKITLDYFTLNYKNDIFDAIIESQQNESKKNNQPIRLICCGSLFLYRDLKIFF